MLRTLSAMVLSALLLAPAAGCAGFDGVGRAKGTTSRGFPEANAMIGQVAVDWVRAETHGEQVVRVYIYEDGWSHRAHGRRTAAAILITTNVDRSACYEIWGRLVDHPALGPHFERDRRAKVTCDSITNLLPSHASIPPDAAT